MKKYIELLKTIREEGEEKIDRTGTGTIEIPDYNMEFDLRDGFPLLTTKKMHTKSIIHELLWFISGSTNIKPLLDNGVKIWNGNAYDYYKKQGYIASDDHFIEAVGKFGYNLGEIYGYQWRNRDGVDQLQNLMTTLKLEPNSRRMIVDCWDVKRLNRMALPPCHFAFQLYHHNDGTIDLKWHQRSVDVFLGLPFNIASYALLLHMIAMVTGKKAGKLRCTLSNVHIYQNHIEQVKEQISREPKNLPKLSIRQNRSCIDDFKYEDFEIIGYESHKQLRGIMAV